jgi:hypothetical protein
VLEVALRGGDAVGAARLQVLDLCRDPTHQHPGLGAVDEVEVDGSGPIRRYPPGARGAFDGSVGVRSEYGAAGVCGARRLRGPAARAAALQGRPGTAAGSLAGRAVGAATGSATAWAVRRSHRSSSFVVRGTHEPGSAQSKCTCRVIGASRCDPRRRKAPPGRRRVTSRRQRWQRRIVTIVDSLPRSPARRRRVRRASRSACPMRARETGLRAPRPVA